MFREESVMALQVLAEMSEKGKSDRATLIKAILDLEKLPEKGGNLEDLEGEWQLVWTSGTKNYQNFNPQGSSGSVDRYNNVRQKISPKEQRLETSLDFGFGIFKVTGSFDYTAKKRLEFRFDRVFLTIGTVTILEFPLGNWAKGWLQITYLDRKWLIERGDKGGVSVYKHL